MIATSVNQVKNKLRDTADAVTVTNSFNAMFNYLVYGRDTVIGQPGMMST